MTFELLVTISLRFPVMGRPDLADTFDLIACLDAENECAAHGRMPHDPTPPCGCWPGLEAEVVVLPGSVESVRRAA